MVIGIARRMMAHQISPRQEAAGLVSATTCIRADDSRQAPPFAPRLNLFCHAAGSGSLGHGPGSSSTRTRLFPYAAGLKTIFDDLAQGGEYRLRRLFPRARRLLSRDGERC